MWSFHRLTGTGKMVMDFRGTKDIEGNRRTKTIEKGNKKLLFPYFYSFFLKGR